MNFLSSSPHQKTSLASPAALIKTTSNQTFDIFAMTECMDMNSISHASHDVHVSPAVALELVSKFNYAHQRPCSKKHVMGLAEAMKRQEFRPYTEICFAVLDGQPILINGQHTLNALGLSRDPLWLSFKFYLTKNAKEIESLYSTMDVGRTRSARDAMGGIGEELNLATTERDRLGVAAVFIHNGFQFVGGNITAAKAYESKNFELRKELMRQWRDEAATYFSCINAANVPRANKEFFLRGSVVAIGLCTVRSNPKKAIEFWSTAVLDDGLRMGDPRKTLFNWLRANPVGSALHKQHRAATLCWNAWCEGRSLSNVYTATEKANSIFGYGAVTS